MRPAGPARRSARRRRRPAVREARSARCGERRRVRRPRSRRPSRDGPRPGKAGRPRRTAPSGHGDHAEPRPAVGPMDGDLALAGEGGKPGARRHVDDERPDRAVGPVVAARHRATTACRRYTGRRRSAPPAYTALRRTAWLVSGSGRAVVSIRASRVTRSGACATISSATMPPSENPASAKLSGAVRQDAARPAPARRLRRRSCRRRWPHGSGMRARTVSNTRWSQSVPGSSSRGSPIRALRSRTSGQGGASGPLRP